MAPVLLDPSGITVFAKLLSWHMEKGTRFNGTPEAMGRFWEDGELAEAVGVQPLTVKNWADGIYRPRPKQFPTLERVLFGDKACYRIWKVQFRRLWRQARTRRRKTPQAPALSPPIGSPAGPSVAGAAGHVPGTEATGASRRVIDIDRLPGTPFKRLAGRDADLALLDAAFAADSRVKILSIVGWGGSGKTALLNAWLRRIQSEGYCDAEAVLGWSFYNQGTQEHTASSDLFLSWALACLGAGVGLVGPTARGEALAHLLQERRVLLILDGVEALQHGPGTRLGDLKDLGFRTLLRRFAADVPRTQGSLVLLTSRVAVSDIAIWEEPGGSAGLHRLTSLSREAGADLLRDNGVHGIGTHAELQLQDASQEFGGHPLALSLLAAFLAQRFGGDVRSRDRIGALLPEDAAIADEHLHGHARRVMRSIQTGWLSGEPVFHAIMELVGLFDRPATPDCLAALLEDGGVPGLSERLAGLSHQVWSAAVARLRKANLLLPPGDGPERSLDAHPLVREWFGEGLHRRDPDAWRGAHARLYAHLCRTREGEHPSREALEPLYRAIVHGCRADRHQSALMEVYGDRICRQRPNADISNYAGQVLGAVSENLAAVSAFFVEPYETVHPSLDDAQRHWLLSEAAFGLREAGRLAEAAQPQRLAVKICAQQRDWMKACIAAYNLSEIYQLSGELPRALNAIADARKYAERTGDLYWLFIVTWYEAELYLLKGDHDEAATLLTLAAEQALPAYQETYLSAVRRLANCGVRLRLRDWFGTRKRAIDYERAAARHGWRLPEALAKLFICRSEFGKLSASLATNPPLATDSEFPEFVQALGASFDGMLDALAATDLSSERPRGYLARARYRIALGDWPGAALDLDESHEIASIGPMRLYLAEVALLRCRLIVARRQVFAPLATDGIGTGGVAGELPEGAAAYLQEARHLIWQCSYFDLRDEWRELSDIVADRAVMSMSCFHP